MTDLYLKELMEARSKPISKEDILEHIEQNKADINDLVDLPGGSITLTIKRIPCTFSVSELKHLQETAAEQATRRGRV